MKAHPMDQINPDSLPLNAKGRFAPPPVLKGPAGRVALEIATWPKVISATHWRLGQPGVVDGADFYVGEQELGHIHLDGEVHLATSLELRKTFLAKKQARPFPYYASWVEASIETEAEADHALWLFKVNYTRLMGADIINGHAD